MSINLQTLKCAECGSGALRSTDLNQYVCEHCGSIAVVEDDVSQRLDRVLETVKDAAARRLADEAALRRKDEAFNAGDWIILLVIAAAFVGAGGWLFSGPKERSGQREIAAPRAAVAARASTISPEGLKLTDPRQVVVGSGIAMEAALLVIARNETGSALSRAGIKATLYDGGTRYGEVSESVPLNVLQAGESAPVLIRFPHTAPTVTHQDLVAQSMSVPARTVRGETLRFEKVRMVQKGDDVSVAAQLRNPLKDQTIVAFDILVTVYDEGGAVIGFGRERSGAGELSPGEATKVNLRVTRFGNAAVKSWDYRIGYDLKRGDEGSTAVIADNRIVRTEGAPEMLSPELQQSVDDLLADETERFDLAQLELLPLAAGHNMTQDLVYMTELVNYSKDTIAVAPAAVISKFEGHRDIGRTPIGSGVTYLYPGERLPIQLDPGRAHRITQTKIEWKTVRKAAMPGARPPLDVRIEQTRAKTGTIEVNFRRVYPYRYAVVRGVVSNPGKHLVRKARVWVSLRDRDDKLTGFELKELPPIPPGESVPFEVDVEQWGRDFVSASTMYQTE
ncbi:FxLYD domain-containing protein [Paraburkholderia sediminicola]|nr:FxLYD domain-containing protein [Paraburkholderia sediminicola]